MRSVIWLVLLFVVAVVAATTLGRNDGLVSIYFGGWRTDLSLNLFVILVLLACVVLMLAARSIGSLVSLPQRAREWRQLRHERAAQAGMRESLAEYFAARYSRAHRAAQRALVIQDDTDALKVDTEFRVLGHLLAAASLHRLQDRPRRDEMMRQLRRLLRKGSLSRTVDEGARLLAAEWAIDDRDAARAIELLGELPPGVARRTQAMRLRLLAQRLTQQPLPALQTARLLAKHQAFSPTAAASLLRTLAGEALDAARDADGLRRVWQQLDAADRRDASVAARAATLAAEFGAHEDARLWLRPFWERMAELEPDERECGGPGTGGRRARHRFAMVAAAGERGARAAQRPGRRRRCGRGHGRTAAVGQGAPPAGTGSHCRQPECPRAPPRLALSGASGAAGG